MATPKDTEGQDSRVNVGAVRNFLWLHRSVRSVRILASLPLCFVIGRLRNHIGGGILCHNMTEYAEVSPRADR